jgi:hypothetical protein
VWCCWCCCAFAVGGGLLRALCFCVHLRTRSNSTAWRVRLLRDTHGGNRNRTRRFFRGGVLCAGVGRVAATTPHLTAVLLAASALLAAGVWCLVLRICNAMSPLPHAHAHGIGIGGGDARALPAPNTSTPRGLGLGFPAASGAPARPMRDAAARRSALRPLLS